MLNLVTTHGELDLNFTPSGTAGYEELHTDATTFDVGRFRVQVASLADVIRPSRPGTRPGSATPSRSSPSAHRSWPKHASTPHGGRRPRPRRRTETHRHRADDQQPLGRWHTRVRTARGPDHPDTLFTRGNIASWTGEVGEPAEALRLFGELLPDQVRVLGAAHPDTLSTQRRIALEGGLAPAKHVRGAVVTLSSSSCSASPRCRYTPYRRTRTVRFWAGVETLDCGRGDYRP